jgi:hypothetical protein
MIDDFGMDPRQKTKGANSVDIRHRCASAGRRIRNEVGERTNKWNEKKDE